MSCKTCGKHNVRVEGVQGVQAEPLKTLPTDQCIACVVKHIDEAYMLFLEYGYSRENARLCRGNLRAIVLHTYKKWPNIADKARECALLLQENKAAEAEMRALCDMIDDAFEKVE